MVVVVGAVLLILGLLFAAVLLFPVNWGFDMGALSEVTNPRCNLSQYNASDILFEGDSQYPPRVRTAGAITSYGIDKHWVDDWCTPAHRVFNMLIKFFSFYFCFVNGLPLPWTMSIWMDAHFPRKKAMGRTGVDFCASHARVLPTPVSATTNRYGDRYR